MKCVDSILKNVVYSNSGVVRFKLVVLGGRHPSFLPGGDQGRLIKGMDPTLRNCDSKGLISDVFIRKLFWDSDVYPALPTADSNLKNQMFLYIVGKMHRSPVF